MNNTLINGFLVAILMASSSYGQLTYAIANEEVTITGYSGELSGHLDIPASIEGYPVTKIGSLTFMFCDNLTSVSFADSVLSIGSDAFYSCDSLTNVNFGNNVQRIRANAFRFSRNLPSVVIPGSITSIEYHVFSECRNMTNIFFCGNAPSVDSTSFDYAPATVYRRYGATGWPPIGQLWLLKTTALWRATFSLAESSSEGLSLHFVGPPNDTAIIERATHFTDHNWTPVDTNFLINGQGVCTVDKSTTDTTGFYRVILSYE